MHSSAACVGMTNAKRRESTALLSATASSLPLDASQDPHAAAMHPPAPAPAPRVAHSARPKRKAQVAEESAVRAAAAASHSNGGGDFSCNLGHISSPTADDDDDLDEHAPAEEAGSEAHQRMLQHIASPVVVVGGGGEAKRVRRSPEASAAAAATAAAAAAASPALRPVVPLYPHSPARIGVGAHDGSGSGSGSQDVRSHRSPQQLPSQHRTGRGRGRARQRPSISSSDSGSGGGGSGSRSSSTDSSSGSGSGSGSEESSDSSDNEEQLSSQQQEERARMLATEQPPEGDAAAAAAAAYGDEDGGLSASLYDTPLFRCTSTHIDSILQMLNAIRLEKKKDQVCRLTLGSLGMKVSCELAGSRAMCAKAYLKRDLFSEYRLNVNMIRGDIGPQSGQQGVDYTCHLSLNSLIDSLMILGSGQKDASKELQSCVMHLEILAQNHPLVVTLDGDAGGDRHNVTTAELQMRDQVGSDSQDGFHIGKDKLLLAVVQATPFRHAFSELDMSDVDVLTMTATIDEHNKSTFAMSVKGHGGMETELELSHEPGSNVFYGDKIELPNRGFKLNYDIKHLRPCIRALHKANMSNFRIGIDGLMSIQHILPIASTEGVSSQWVEFFISAKEMPETEDLMPHDPMAMVAYNGGGAEAAAAVAGAVGVDEGMIVRDDDEEKQPDPDISMRSPVFMMEHKHRELQSVAMQ